MSQHMLHICNAGSACCTVTMSNPHAPRARRSLQTRTCVCETCRRAAQHTSQHPLGALKRPLCIMIARFACSGLKCRRDIQPSTALAFGEQLNHVNTKGQAAEDVAAPCDINPITSTETIIEPVSCACNHTKHTFKAWALPSDTHHPPCGVLQRHKVDHVEGTTEGITGKQDS